MIHTYHVFSDNKESGLGYPDMVIIPKTKEISDLAIVLEFKRVIPSAKEKERDILDLAQEALKQIDERQYVAALADYPHVKRVSKVGMAFQGKEVHWEAVEETLGFVLKPS